LIRTQGVLAVEPWHTIGAVAVVLGRVAGAVHSAAKLAKSAAQFFRETSEQRENSESARRLLGLSADRTRAYRHDSVHSLFTHDGVPHPDNLAALQTLAGYDIAAAASHGALTLEPSPTTEISNDLVLIGSPMAESLSRAVFGYIPEPGVQDSLGLVSPPVTLHWTWELSAGAYKRARAARRHVPGKGVSARPNWALNGPTSRAIPRLDSEGFVVEDYLLITKLRNFLGEHDVEGGRFVVSVGGTHGIGTRGVELLIRDSNLLTHVSDLVGAFESPCYQALFQVSNIQHSARRGSSGRSIQLVDVREVDDNKEAWESARGTFLENLERLGLV
jgi:hypothetical protein